MLRHGSLFSGIGGFDLAAEWCGWENIFHCEWNEFGQRVLKHYWPEADSFGDITKTDFTKYRGTIDIISGGFPCQPYSSAGKRKGKEDERHLWPEMLRVIREVQPRYVVGENVYGLLNWNGGLVFDEVHADLAAEGYETQAVVIPAAAVNAPHGRDRVWFVAKYTANPDSDGQHGNNCEYEKQPSQRGQYAQRNLEPMGGDAADADSWGLEGTKEVRWDSVNVERKSKFGFIADALHKGLQGSEFNGPLNRGEWQQSKPCTPVTKFRKATNWEQFPTQSPLCGGNDGLPRELDGITFPKWRAESIKAYGNAIVPQVAYQIFKTIDFLDQNK